MKPTWQVDIVRQDRIFAEHDVALQLEPSPGREVVVVIAGIKLSRTNCLGHAVKDKLF